MPDDSESTQPRCMECGAGIDLQELLHYEIDGDRGTVTSHWICRSCLTAGEMRYATETAAFWEAQFAGPEHQREQVRAHCIIVAATLRDHLAALGLSPDGPVAAFIARHSN